jgi:hypothetical protein
MSVDPSDDCHNSSGATLATVLNVRSKTGAWTSVSFDTSAYAVVLWFNVHDDGCPTRSAEAARQGEGTASSPLPPSPIYGAT